MSISSKHGVSEEPRVRVIDPSEESIIRFGGLDLAKRTDHSALEILKMKGDVLIEEGFLQWGHVNYGQVAKDLHKIHGSKFMNTIGFDRTGVGDAAIELFDTITLPMEPIVMTNNRKIECVNAVQTMFQTGQLKISSKSPVREQLEMQQVKKSAAGNLIYEHPSGTHDDLFWALAYAVYVSIPFIANGGRIPIIKRGSDQLVERNADFEFNDVLDNMLGSSSGGLGTHDLEYFKRKHIYG